MRELLIAELQAGRRVAIGDLVRVCRDHGISFQQAKELLFRGQFTELAALLAG